MNISQELYGALPSGEDVQLFTLSNTRGLIVRVMSYGAAIVSIDVPDRNGTAVDVTLGFDTLQEWVEKNVPYFGVVVGRVGNRISNAAFTLDGVRYLLSENTPPNHLHGGMVGFDKQLWTAEQVNTVHGDGIKFTYTSPDGEQGYPGTLTSSVTYVLTDDNALYLIYSATTDMPTPINLTNHAYFNLTGDGSQSILDHVAMINADSYTAVDDTLIPTGEIASVENSPFDFRVPTAIGARINRVPGGYDLNYVLNKEGRELSLAGRVTDPGSGRFIEVQTTQPGMQLYTGNFLDNIAGKSGTVYNKHAAFCLETQHFPDAPNQPNFPSIILRPGEEYAEATIFTFGAE
jgi:aldose 1-epimerase